MRNPCFLVFLLFVCLANAQPGSLIKGFNPGGNTFNIGSYTISAESVNASVKDDLGNVYIHFSLVPHEGITFNESCLIKIKQDGSIDSTFGKNGRILTDFDISFPSKVFIHNNKLYVFGGYYDMQLPSVGVYINQYDLQGNLILSFGNNGTFLMVDPLFYVTALDVCVSNQGFSLIVHQTDGNSHNLFLTRVDFQGAIDISFGINGKVILPDSYGNVNILTNSLGDLYTLLLDANGDCSLLKFLEDGNSDSNFGTSGELFFSNSSSFFPLIITTNDLGEIFFINKDSTLKKFTPSGLIDGSFNLTGNLKPNADAHIPLLLNLNNKFAAIMQNWDSNNFLKSSSTISMLNYDGSFDITFGIGGQIIKDFNVNSIIKNSDGSYYLIGTKFTYYQYSSLIIQKINSDGSINSEFNKGESLMLRSDLRSNEEQLHSIIETNDGILLGGQTILYLNHDKLSSYESTVNIGLTKLMRNGNIDKNFSNNGTLMLDSTIGSLGLNRVTLGEDYLGNMYTVGNSFNFPAGTSRVKPVIIKLDPFGKLVENFGENGILRVDSPLFYSFFINSTLIDSLSKSIFIGGFKIYATYSTCAISKIGFDGTIKTFFNGDSLLEFQLMDQLNASLAMAAITDMKFDANRNIILGGRNNSIFEIAKIDTLGVLDNSFNSVGHSFFNVPNSEQSFFFYPDISIDQNNNTIISSTIKNGSSFQFAISKVDPSGNLVSSFDGDGSLLLSLPQNLEGDTLVNSWSDMELDKYGNIYLAGNTFNGSEYKTALLRLDANGNLDSLFGTNGMALFPKANPFAPPVLLYSSDSCIYLGRTTDKDLKGIYYYQVAENTNKDFEVFKVQTNLAPISVLPPDSGMCYGASLQLDAKLKKVNYKWYLNGTLISTVKNPTFTESGEYVLQVQDGLGYSAYDTCQVVENPKPIGASFLASYQSGSDDELIVYDTSNPKPDSVQWNWGGDIAAKVGNQYRVTFPAAGNYVLQQTNWLGYCSQTISDTISIIPGNLFPDSDGMFSLLSATGSPNPTSGVYKLQVKLELADNIEVNVYDVFGTVQYSFTSIESSKAFNKDIDLSSWAPGTYTIKVLSSSDIQIIRIEKI